jgi:hypothetical protein
MSSGVYFRLIPCLGSSSFGVFWIRIARVADRHSFSAHAAKSQTELVVRHAVSCSCTTLPAPVSMPSRASASRCSAAATCGRLPASVVTRGQRRTDRDMVQCGLDHVRQLAHFAQHRRSVRRRSWRVHPPVPLASCRAFVSRSQFPSGAPVDVAKFTRSAPAAEDCRHHRPAVGIAASPWPVGTRAQRASPRSSCRDRPAPRLHVTSRQQARAVSWRRVSVSSMTRRVAAYGRPGMRSASGTAAISSRERSRIVGTAETAAGVTISSASLAGGRLHLLVLPMAMQTRTDPLLSWTVSG